MAGNWPALTNTISTITNIIINNNNTITNIICKTTAETVCNTDRWCR